MDENIKDYTDKVKKIVIQQGIEIFNKKRKAGKHEEAFEIIYKLAELITRWEKKDNRKPLNKKESI